MNVIAKSYKLIFKPIAFKFDPEFVHDRVIDLGIFLGKFNFTRNFIRELLDYENPKLAQNILGIEFKNPIGLAAGFDKNAQLTHILGPVGFGYAEIGSVTGEYCPGNPGKRLWRLPKSESLLVYYGLKNDGAEAIAKRLVSEKFSLPIGISVAKTNCQATAEDKAGIADYVKAYKTTLHLGSYTTLNISCPNAFGGQPFTDPVRLENLLVETDKIKTHKPVFIKLSPDLEISIVDELLAVALKHNVQGVICSNLTKERNNEKIVEQNIPTVGGFSGKLAEDLSNQLLAHVYKKVGNKLVVIGCGGVFTAEDAYKKIRLGASLIQLITGMIFKGPQLIGEINQGLIKLLERDGFNNISEAIGIDNK